MPAPQVPSAQGRFLVSNPMTIPSRVAHDALAKAFPGYKFPAGKDEPSKVVIDNSKAWPPPSASLVTGLTFRGQRPLTVARLHCLASLARTFRAGAPAAGASSARRCIKRSLALSWHACHGSTCASSSLHSATPLTCAPC